MTNYICKLESRNTHEDTFGGFICEDDFNTVSQRPTTRKTECKRSVIASRIISNQLFDKAGRHYTKFNSGVEMG